MHRIAGLLGGLIVSLLLLVPIAAAAEPWGRSEAILVSTGTNVTLSADQQVDVLVVVAGHARVEGDARTIIVIGGTAELIGAQSSTIVAYESSVTLDAASAVSGDIRTRDSTVVNAPGSIIGGTVRDLGPDLALGWIPFGSALFLVYAAFAISAIGVGVALAGLAGRQVRTATAAIGAEPLQTIGASILGLIGLITAAVLAIVTIVGIPLGIGMLVIALPALCIAGYLVAGIALGEAIVGRTSGGVVRERPYLAAIVGLAIVGVISIVPPFGGLVSLVGIGAVVLTMWRVFRRGRATVTGEARQVAPATG